MKLLMVVPYFVPEIGSTAHIHYDLAKGFVKSGHEVDVITSYPRPFNMVGSDQDREFPNDETIEGINIHRCRHPMTRDNVVVRGLEHFYLPLYYFSRFRQLKKKFDVCLMHIPPLPLYYLAREIKRYDGTPSVLNIQDFHPQELMDVGVLRNPAIVKILEHIERRSYKNADYITVMSEGGIRYVVDRGADQKRVSHIFNSVSPSEFSGLVQRKDFKEREGVEGKFLVSYAGILSPFQGIDNILDTAKALQDHGDIIFYVAGDGMEKGHLEARIHLEEINNVRLLPLLPRSEYFNLVNSSDLSFVSLDERMKAPCLPGKMINLMACSQPIIAMVAEESETADVVRKAECGIVVKPGDVAGIRSAILRLREDVSVRKAMGSSGRAYLDRNMNLEMNVALYEQIFRTLAGDGVFAGRLSSSRDDGAPGVGHSGL
jgi:colanic acid biosynthesis glycosyl transferase WcaI